MKNKIILLLFLLAGSFSLYAQVDPQVELYRSDDRGNFKYEKESVMDGNLVRTLFKNTTEVAHWPFMPSGEWPKGTGHAYIDGVTVLIAAQVSKTKNGQVVHPVEASYREEMDQDPVTGEIWGLEPLPGYSNLSSTKPAMSIDKTSWPAVWPKATFRYDYPASEAARWDGHWYGYFGLDQKNADFETFFVVDDNRDGEFRRAPYSYFPIHSDTTWGGLGIRVETRGFQWSHVLAEDIIFWHYDIVNISDVDYDSTCFGFYSDPGVGGKDDNGDNVRYDKYLDLTYAWDIDGKGTPGGWITGYYGYAYLESPGNATNGIDDDEDATKVDGSTWKNGSTFNPLMVDERRDDGIDNDEDWVGFLDLNNNGKWDPATEPVNNDVGKDGVGPYDPQYTGPDEGEGDGKPTDGEPNFDKTDKDESDQIGLNAVSLVNLAHTPSNPWPKYDEVVWSKMVGGFADTTISDANVNIVFSSGPFPLKKGLRERYSMALVFGSDKEDMIFNKVTVQQIYNANYNFSKPPVTPMVNAVAGDKKVILYWDKKAEESRDPFLGFEYDANGNRMGFKKDFEGYLIYKSREPEFNDIKIITDSRGEPKYSKPIAQFDKVDGIKGPDPVGINGARFWRGSETGIQNSYIDTDVKNGEKYYYAVVSYDMGDPKFGTSGLQPSECTKIITEDFAGNVQFVDINCAVVVPNAPASGYIPPEIVGDVQHVSSGIGTGSLIVNVLDPGKIINGAGYSVRFNSDSLLYQYTTKSYDVVRSYQGVDSVMLPGVDSTFFGKDKMGDVFDGLSLSVINDTSIALDFTKSGWVVRNNNANLIVTQDVSSKGIKWPADYEIEFYDHVVDTTFIKGGSYVVLPINFRIKNITEGRYVKIAMADPDKSGGATLTIGDEIRILESKTTPITTGNALTVWSISCSLPFGGATPVDPAPGDIFRISTTRPLHKNDAFTFSTKVAAINNGKAKTDLEKISVVPNPYLGAASWEKRNLNASGRGERKIEFINLPEKCEIKIYTMAGYLVKTLQKDSPLSDGSLTWNLVSEDGMDIAYGIYVFHVKAEGIGEHIGKFAVIK
ncbi:MAG: hypothetical protein M0P61_04685 [Ignavibacteriaceae bacterium]|nr:hypothetical protein [Ignavibacteriaceae bacterium]